MADYWDGREDGMGVAPNNPCNSQEDFKSPF